MSITNYIINLLQIKDKNIYFSNEMENIVMKGTKFIKLFATLSYKTDVCPICGHMHSVIFYGFNKCMIRLLPCAGNPILLQLKKRRFLCKNCKHTFSAKSNIVNKNASIANQVFQHIHIDLAKKLSEKDIAKAHFVSHSTVSRCIDNNFRQFTPNYNYLPKHLCFDEFKSTKDAKGAMSFIFCNAKTHDIIDIVENRQFNFLDNYFKHFSKDARASVKTICIDIYSPYIKLINTHFPNAKIIFDKFHIINLINRALIKTRIETMRKFSVNSMEYKRLKRYWKLIQENIYKLNNIHFRKYVHFKRWKSSLGVVEETVSCDPVLKETYYAYQLLLNDITNKDIDSLKEDLISLRCRVSKYMKTSIDTILRYIDYVDNTLHYEYTNGCIEGINNYIKVLKRVAFGYKSFFHFRNRILISKRIMQVK